jgi:hypothetical protein
MIAMKFELMSHYIYRGSFIIFASCGFSAQKTVPVFALLTEMLRIFIVLYATWMFMVGIITSLQNTSKKPMTCYKSSGTKLVF